MEENNVMAVETAEIIEEDSGNGGLLVGMALGAGIAIGGQWLYKKAIKPLGQKIKSGVANRKMKKLDTDSEDTADKDPE